MVTQWRGSTASRPLPGARRRRGRTSQPNARPTAGSASACRSAGPPPFSRRGNSSTRAGGCTTGTRVPRPRSRRGHPARAQRIRIAKSRALPPPSDHRNRTHFCLPRVACRNRRGRRRRFPLHPARVRRAHAIRARDSRWQPARQNENPPVGNGYCRTLAMRYGARDIGVSEWTTARSPSSSPSSRSESGLRHSSSRPCATCAAMWRTFVNAWPASKACSRGLHAEGAPDRRRRRELQEAGTSRRGSARRYIRPSVSSLAHRRSIFLRARASCRSRKNSVKQNTGRAASDSRNFRCLG